MARRFAHALLILALAVAARPAQALELRVATLAPKNSAWAKAMENGAKQAEKSSDGRLSLRYYFSAQQGDERDMVRKLASGQIDGAVLTAVGLGLIEPSVRVLELPGLFDSVEELDHVRDGLTPTFEKRFADKGYVLVNWGDVGWVHTFSTEPRKSVEDLRKAKAWVWGADPITRAMHKRLGINGVPLGVPEVLTGLATGQIDTCYGSPLAVIALQWHTKVKYASERALSYAVGGFVVRKDVFDSLSPEDRARFLSEARANARGIIGDVRRDNERAKKALVKNGLVFLPAPAATERAVREAAVKVWADLTGTLYDQALLAEAVRLRDEARAARAKAFPKAAPKAAPKTKSP
jgi:TRAP-type C4-dicarboxylate transport system substrate-binding protein